MVRMHKTYKHYTFLVLHVTAVLQTCLPLRILTASSQERQDAIDVVMIRTLRDHNVGMKETVPLCGRGPPAISAILPVDCTCANC
jgi:hypothetical protein